MLRSNLRYKKNKSKIDFVIYDHHSESGFNKTSKRFKKSLGNLGDDYIGVVSIDPGTVNIGFYIMFFWNNGKSQSYALERFNFCVGDKEDDVQSVQKYKEAELILDEYLEIFKNTHYILIESQLTVNPSSMRMSQHFISYFTIKLKDIGVKPVVIEISAELKTRIIGGPIGKLPKGTLSNGKILNKKETNEQAKSRRKKWCQKKSQEIMTLTEDPFVEKVIKRRSKKGEGKSKRDDMGDVVCQAWAWLKLCSQNEWWESFSETLIDDIINVTEYVPD